MTHNLTPGASLTSKQRKAVDALLSTGEVTAAAKETGVARETLQRWLKQPVFNQAVKDAEARAIDDLSRMLVRLGRTATATLAKAMTDAAVPMTTRVRAADISLSRLLQLRELATLEARVTELERSVGLEEAR
jgi:phage terminase small subunit